MQKKIIVGNLGADAEIKRENGREFVSFSIANTERHRKPDGSYEEKTNWVSATLNGNGGNLFQFLKKGAKVYAYGDYSVRMFHSEKQRALVAGVNLYVRDIELISTNVDAVPRDLYDEDGVAHRVSKYFWVEDKKKCQLYDRNGTPYLIDDKGFVWPPAAATAAEDSATNDSQDVNSNATSDINAADGNTENLNDNDAPF